MILISVCSNMSNKFYAYYDDKWVLSYQSMCHYRVQRALVTPRFSVHRADVIRSFNLDHRNVLDTKFCCRQLYYDLPVRFQHKAGFSKFLAFFAFKIILSSVRWRSKWISQISLIRDQFNRDRLVCGIQNQQTRAKLLRERYLTLQSEPWNNWQSPISHKKLNRYY